MLRNLPPEIVSEIVSHLPYRDVVALRRVFTREDLRDVTNAHVVWLNLAKQYVAENPHSDFSEAEFLSSLTTDQLHERFEKRLMVNDIWRLSKGIYPSIKCIKKLSSSIKTMRIAPGGRWLFAGTSRCSVYYWDLDSLDPEPVLLAPCGHVDNTPGENNAVAKIDFLVEHGDPLSGFIMAWVGQDFHGDCKKSGEWLHIWDVISQENGSLLAKHLKILPLPYNRFRPQLSLNDSLVARAMKGRVDVYWWRECTETHLVRCKLEFKSNPIITSLHVLGNDKLLVFTRYQDRHKARLYALEQEYSEISEFGKVASHATKVWSFRFNCAHYYGREISRLYFDGANYCQIIATRNGIFSLTIPASEVDKLTVTKVSDFDLYQRESDAQIYSLGFNKGYCRVGADLYRFGYSPGSTQGSYENRVTFDSRLGRIFHCFESYPSFDEELGRLASISWDHLIIQDFSLPLHKLADVCPDSETWTHRAVGRWQLDAYKTFR